MNPFIPALKALSVMAFAMATIAQPAFAGDCDCNCDLEWVKVEDPGCPVQAAGSNGSGFTLGNAVIGLGASTVAGATGLGSGGGLGAGFLTQQHGTVLSQAGCSIGQSIATHNDSACDLCTKRIQGVDSLWNGNIASWKTDNEKKKQLCYAASGSTDPAVAREWFGNLRVKGKRYYTGNAPSLCGQWTGTKQYFRESSDGNFLLNCAEVFEDVEETCTNGMTCDGNGGIGGGGLDEVTNATAAAQSAMAQAQNAIDGDENSVPDDSLVDTSAAIAGSVGSAGDSAAKAGKNDGVKGLEGQRGGKFKAGAPSLNGGWGGGLGMSLGGASDKDKKKDGSETDSKGVVLAAVDGALYRQGAGAGKAGGGGYGSGSAALSGAGIEGQLNLGRSPSSLNPGGEEELSSVDPEDYFNRIGMAESLFVKIEKRYRIKTGGWPQSTLSRK